MGQYIVAKPRHAFNTGTGKNKKRHDYGGDPFELDDAQAEPHVKSGLLRMIDSSASKSSASLPGKK